MNSVGASNSSRSSRIERVFESVVSPDLGAAATRAFDITGEEVFVEAPEDTAREDDFAKELEASIAASIQAQE